MPQPLKPWTIYRNDKVIAYADSHKQVAGIIRQFLKQYPHDKFTTRFTEVNSYIDVQTHHSND
jgi:hypothetical protein